MTDFAFLAELRRRPDVEAPNLVAVDAADRLLLDTAAKAVRKASHGPTVAVIGDAYGALTLGALELGARDVRVHQDALLGERALAANAALLGRAGFSSLELVPELVADARVILLRLPKSLDQLDEWAGLIAAHAAPDVTVFAAGMVKHMTLAQNEVLGRWFGEVRAGLARQKARVLTARGPQKSGNMPSTAGAAPSFGVSRAEIAAFVQSSWPKTALIDPPGITVSAHGGVFAGASLDIGTRFLLEHLADAKPDAVTAIDLGCGTGVIAAALALARPGLRVHATDQSAAAVASARETMQLNGLDDRVMVVRDDALGSLPDASAELIVLNPPFHSGTTVTADVGIRLMADAARVLAPGGELRVVFNSHLRYQPTLRRLVGETRQVARNSKFTITSSVKGDR
ncbi:class I SAM-dependent methyltransferase [Gryllotalpicola protaetiae]|uniref:Methyltransferase domain-containing protein n=1 Tax=Gryllotalpicola protaetiae TaxID=2419771 RepID=A0A387BQU1_9MICO|nr:class I SAM-dependent methyltransferase [Gryllotalpicola protaetiae]AYG03346.1 methyltransferase domain-containing protein [Gryllotalpicola protaetiae]